MPFINLPAKKKYKRNYSNSEKRKQRQEIYDTTRWRKLRDAYLQSHPLCEMCLAEGRINAENLQIHHKDSFMNYSNEDKRKEVAYDYNNLMTVCQDCHNKLHNNIKKKGRK